MTSPASELEALLSRDVQATRRWERQEFDRRSAGRPVVLMGAGGLGRRALRGLREAGGSPLAFADNGAPPDGGELDGLPLLQPRAAAERFGKDAAFVVTIWGANRPHRFSHSRQQLQALGCDVVCPFPPLFWKYAEHLLPFYLQDLPSHVIEAGADVRRGLDVWADDASRLEYVRQVRLRLLADFDGLSHPVSHRQYFPDDLFAWSATERIVDAGAYDGDTIRVLWEERGGAFAHLLALEPDPLNFANLLAAVAALPPEVGRRIDCRQMALAAARTTLHVAATGTAASATSSDRGTATVEVPAEPLDALLGDDAVTFVKMDIEGAEMDALQGARDTITRQGPVVAVCVYHVQDHLWRIPLLIRSWRPDDALFLRPHNEEGWDLVCYAIPRRRLRAS